MYANLSDLTIALGERRLLRIADREGDGAIDAAVVAAALSAASAEIDSAISKRYKLPMAVVPERLKRIAIDLAHYHLDLDPNDDLRKRVEDARGALSKIATGVYTLEDAELAEIGDTPRTGGKSSNLAEVQNFQSSLDTAGYGE